ncbi:MAG: hypothetical protein OIF57_15570 [Marinobacterium sp.]|nr:hypothetical protein [Marinobacterium sp.]
MKMFSASTLLMLSLAASTTSARAWAQQFDDQRQDLLRQSVLRHYLMQQHYQSHDQHQQMDNRHQQAMNHGGDLGHRLNQQQGAVEVGALVESGAFVSGPPVGGQSFQLAPQSNTLQVGGDNFAPLQLSNIAVSNGSVHIGDVNQGNLYNSQIGSNQSGEQLGNSNSTQVNDQGLMSGPSESVTP